MNSIVEHWCDAGYRQRAQTCSVASDGRKYMTPCISEI
jgi:hypothetical protein